MVINDGSGGPELRPESLEEPKLDTEAHLGKDKAPKLQNANQFVFI